MTRSFLLSLLLACNPGRDVTATDGSTCADSSTGDSSTGDSSTGDSSTGDSSTGSTCPACADRGDCPPGELCVAGECRRPCSPGDPQFCAPGACAPIVGGPFVCDC